MWMCACVCVCVCVCVCACARDDDVCEGMCTKENDLVTTTAKTTPDVFPYSPLYARFSLSAPQLELDQNGCTLPMAFFFFFRTREKEKEERYAR